MLRPSLRFVCRKFCSNARVVPMSSSSSSSSSSFPPPVAPTADASGPARSRLEGVKQMINIVHSEPDAARAWDTLWKQSITPWIQSTSAPALLELIAQDALPKGRALVPGCGHGNDVFALAEMGKRTVIGLDIAPTVIELCEKTRAERQIPSDIALFQVADFFTYKPPEPFDLIYDYTFLGALPPSMHDAWAKQIKSLLSPTGELTMLLFPVDGHKGGPPYAMSPESVVNLLAPLGFKVTHLRPVTNAHKGRLGIEWLARWKLA